MPVLTTTDGPIEFRYSTSAVTMTPGVGGTGSIALRIDAGNVGTYQNIDGTNTGWRQFVLAGGTITFAADATWTLNDNSATALVIGSTGATNMTTWDTTNGAETFAVAARLTTTDGVSGGTARRVGGTAFENPAASAAVANVAAIFSTGSYSIPANTLKVGTILNFYALVGITAVSGGGATVQLRVFLNGLAGTLVFDTTALNVGAGVAANSYFILRGQLACRAVGAPGALTGVMTYSLGAVNAAPGTNSSDIAGSTAGTYTVVVTNANVNTLDITAVTDAAGTTVVLQDYYVEMAG